MCSPGFAFAMRVSVSCALCTVTPFTVRMMSRGSMPDFGGGAADHELRDHDARLRQVEAPRLDVIDVGGQDADPAAHHATLGEDLAHHAANQVHRDRKADAFHAEVLREHRGVDADELAIDIDQRAARIAHVDGRVGLDEVLEGRDAELSAARRADDALRDGLRKPYGIADGEHDVAEAQPVRVTERHHRHVALQVEFEDREVRVRIAADDSCLGHASVGELCADQVRGGDHVVIGDHVRGAIDDNA